MNWNMSTACYLREDYEMPSPGSAIFIGKNDHVEIKSALTETQIRCEYCNRRNKIENDICLSCGAPIT